MPCPECYGYIDQVKELKKRIAEMLEINLNGWKGKDALGFGFDAGDWLLTEHRKDKETGDIKETTHRIPDFYVSRLYTMIAARVEKNQVITYRQIVSDLISKAGFNVTIDSFNGGKNRALFYFKYYYYPMKILEHNGLISYSGRGNAVRLV